MANVGTIIGGGFRLITQRPVTVAIWVAVYAVFSLATSWLFLPGQGLAPDPVALETGAVSPLSFMGPALLVWLASLLFYGVMLCAVYRAVLRPAEGGFAYLRLGMDELRLFGIFLLLIVAAIFLGIVVSLLLGVVLGGMMVASGGGGGTFAIAAILYLALFAGTIFVWVRLSLIFPLSFVRRRIVVDGAWALTRGHFWTLFAAYFVIGVITIMVSMVVLWPFISPYFAIMAEAFSNPAGLQEAQAEQIETRLNMSTTSLLLMTALTAIVSTFSLVLSAGAGATATRELLLDQGEVLDDDAEAVGQIFE